MTEGNASPNWRGRNSSPMANQPGLLASAPQVVVRLLMASLSGALRRKHHPNRGHQDAYVEGQSPVLDIGEIEMHVEIERWTVARGDLPESGHPRFHVQASVVVKFVAANFVHRVRPRPHQAHLPAQHIPELRKFVEAVAADEPTETGDSGVIFELEDGAFPLIAVAQSLLQLVGSSGHGAELVAEKAASLGAGAFRRIESRSG